MIMKHRRVSYEVSSLKEASELFSKMRNESGEGGSTWQNANLYEGSKYIGTIGYNGRIWPCRTRDWTPDTVPFYN